MAILPSGSYTFEDVVRSAENEKKKDTGYTFEDVIASAGTEPEENIDYNLGGHFVHGLQRLPKRWDQASAIEDAQVYTNLRPYADIVEQPDLETQAFVDAGFPADYLDLSAEDQYKWQTEKYPGGLPPELDDLVKGRMKATMATDVEDPRIDPKYISQNLVDTTLALKKHEAQGPQMDQVGIQNIMRSESFWDAAKSFAQNPKAALQITAQSLGESSPLLVVSALAMVATGGTGAGLISATGGYQLNYLFGVAQALEKYGIDPNNIDQVSALIDNPEILNKVLNDAKTYGAVHAAVETPFAVLMGKLLKFGGTGTLGTRVAKRTAAIPVEMAQEGAGEAAALLTIDQGPDKFKEFWPEVALETFAGGAPAALTAAPVIAADVVQTARDRDGAPRGELDIAETIDTTLDETRPVDLELAPEGAPLNVSIATKQQEESIEFTFDLNKDQKEIYSSLRERGANHDDAMEGARISTKQPMDPVVVTAPRVSDQQAPSGEPTVEGVDVSTTSTPIETRLDAIEEPIIDAEETVDRETVVPEYKDRVAGDPLSEPNAWQNFKNTINNVVSNITVGGENAKKGYNKFVQEHLKYFNENPDQAASQPEARANSYLETDESGNERSIYVAEDGTRVELAERLGNMPEPQRENETREEYVTRLKEEAELEPAWSDTLTLFGSFLAADTTGVIKDKFEEFMYQIARYNKNFRDDPRKALKVVIDLGGSGAGNTLNSHANYVGSTNTINVSFNSLMNAEQNWTETAIHELTHQKFWSFFFSQVAKSYPEVNEREAHSLVIRHINEFGFKMFTPFRKEILSFVKKSWAEGGSEAVANRLNISPKLLSSAKNPQEAFDILRNATSIDRSQDFALDLSFSLVHELLAYEGMTIEMLKQEGIVPTAAQRSFIQKFLRYVKQTLQEMLGVKTLSKQDIQEFIIVMFLEPQNAMEVDSSVNTQVMQYYKVDQIRPTLEKIQRAKRGEEPISRMAAEDQPDDPSRRRFMKQTAGAVAGAIVDPTTLAEPATAAAATVAKGIIPQAISTAYRFAVSVPVQTAEGEMIEGESIIDVDYDSESNTLSVQDLDQDGNIITEEKFEVPIKDPTMKDIYDFAASVI